MRRNLRADREGRSQGALGDLHGERGHVDLMLRGDYRGIFEQRRGDRFVQRLRQQLFHALRRFEPLGLDAHHLPVASDADLQQALRGVDIGVRLRERRFRLRNVGARDLTDLEPVPRQAQLLGQHGDITLAQA